MHHLRGLRQEVPVQGRDRGHHRDVPRRPREGGVHPAQAQGHVRDHTRGRQPVRREDPARGGPRQEAAPGQGRVLRGLHRDLQVQGDRQGDHEHPRQDGRRLHGPRRDLLRVRHAEGRVAPGGRHGAVQGERRGDQGARRRDPRPLLRRLLQDVQARVPQVRGGALRGAPHHRVPRGQGPGPEAHGRRRRHLPRPLPPGQALQRLRGAPRGHRQDPRPGVPRDGVQQEDQPLLRRRRRGPLRVPPGGGGHRRHEAGRGGLRVPDDHLLPVLRHQPERRRRRQEDRGQGPGRDPRRADAIWPSA